MMKKFLSVFLLIWFVGCELYNQDEYREMVVVESYAVANRTLPTVYVSTTLPADTEYSFSNAALNDAVVQVSLLDETGEEEEVFSYTAGASDGVYLPQNSVHSVLPERTYRLDIQFNTRPEVLRAYTTIPDDFTIQNEVRDTVTYQSEEQLELVISAVNRHQEQNVFVINTISLNPAEENLTPFYRSALEDNDMETGDFTNNSSGLINEGNFTVNEDGTITLRFPWIGVAFYEDNLVVTNSVDKNLTDLVRSQEVQLGGSTLPPGEIPNVRYYVEGGIGIFGSLSSDTVETYFKRPF